MQEDDQNPNSDIASFDTIYFAALQVFIVSSANGVSCQLPLSSCSGLTNSCSVVTVDVPDDGLGVLCLVLLFHRLHRCPEFLAYQPVRRGHHEHILGNSKGYVKECIRSGSVRAKLPTVTAWFL